MSRTKILIKSLYATELIQLRSQNDFIDEIQDQLKSGDYDAESLAAAVSKMHSKHNELMDVFDELVDIIDKKERSIKLI